MKIEFNRRTFLVVLGAAAAASVVRPKRLAPMASSTAPIGIFFFSTRRCEPAGRPRTSAITYVQENRTAEPATQG